jgi:hypothetical protein
VDGGLGVVGIDAPPKENGSAIGRWLKHCRPVELFGAKGTIPEFVSFSIGAKHPHVALKDAEERIWNFPIAQRRSLVLARR